MQEICPREKCTGCAACYNVCPKNCIQMKENEYGEVQPFIVEKECIDCGSCHRVCIRQKKHLQGALVSKKHLSGMKQVGDSVKYINVMAMWLQ